MDYLDYLKLDEPIIGLNCLEQMESQQLGNGQLRLKYKCKLCSLEADLAAMVSHVVGRKHRQKFLELERPDLVTWDKFNNSQQGKVIRAKAEVVERQEGRGRPKDFPRQRNPRWNGPQRANAPQNPKFQHQRQDLGHQQGGLNRDREIYDLLNRDIPPRKFQEKRDDDGYYPENTYTRAEYPEGAEYPEDAPYQRYYQEEDNAPPDFSEGSGYGKQHLTGNPFEKAYPEDGIRRRPPLPDDPPRQTYHERDRYDPPFFEDGPQGRPQAMDDRPDLPYPEEEQHQRIYRYDHRSRPPYSDRERPLHSYGDSHARTYQEEEPVHQRRADSPVGLPYSEREARGHSYPRDERHPLAPVGEYAEGCPKEDAYKGYEEDDHERDRYGRSYAEEDSSDWHPRVDTDRRFAGCDGSGQYPEHGFQPRHSSEDDRRQRLYSGVDSERNRGDEIDYVRSAPESGMQRDWSRERELPLRPDEIRKRPYPDFPQDQATFQESFSAKRKKSRFSDCTEAEIDLLLKCQRAKAVSEKLVQNTSSQLQRHPESDHFREDYRQRRGVEQDFDHRSSESERLREDFRERGRAEQDPGNFVDVHMHSESGRFREDYRDRRVEQDPGSVQDVYRRSEGVRLRDDYREQGEAEQDSGNVLDVLKGVQIESVEEANFLKTKLCSLLKEFQASKTDRERDQVPPKVSEEYGHSRRGVQEQPMSIEYSHRTREMPAVEMVREDFRQVTSERFDRAYEQDQLLHRRELSRPAERFEEYPRRDFHRGEYRPPPKDGPIRYNEGSQRTNYDYPPEEVPRDMRPVRARYEDEINPPSSLDKIASTLLQLVAHK